MTTFKPGRKDHAESFLLASVSYRFGSIEGAARLRELAGGIEPGDLSRLREDAAYHDLECLLHLVGEDCSRLGHSLELPDELSAGWGMIQEREQIRSTLIHYGAVQALAALESAGVRAIPLKGYYVASRFYDRPGARGFRDLDLLVESDSLPSLNHALLDAGFRPDAERPSFVPAPAYTVYYLPMEGSDTAMEIDIHVGMHWPQEYFQRTAFVSEDLWSHAQPEPLDGITSWGMIPAHLVITTLLDLSINHRYARLIGFRDLLEILAKIQLDWAALLDWSRRWGVQSFVGPGLHMLAGIGPSDLIPDGVLESLTPSYPLMRLFMRNSGLDKIPDRRARSFTLSNLIFFLLADTPRARLRGLLGIPSHVIRGRHRF